MVVVKRVARFIKPVESTEDGRKGEVVYCVWVKDETAIRGGDVGSRILYGSNLDGINKREVAL